jgi:hypothetical protein
MAYCSNLEYGGHDDWRLPNPFEFASIVDVRSNSTSTEPAAFPGSRTGFYWSSSRSVESDEFAKEYWAIWFFGGGLFSASDFWGEAVRCVRGGLASGPETRFVETEPVKGEKIVSDATTGLVWQKDYSEKCTWKQALGFCAALKHGGFDDWRLPNINEMMSIVNFSKSSPATDLTVESQYYFWSSTSRTEYPDYAFGIFLRTGEADVQKKGADTLSARCVRGGP